VVLFYEAMRPHVNAVKGQREVPFHFKEQIRSHSCNMYARVDAVLNWCTFLAWKRVQQISAIALPLSLMKLVLTFRYGHTFIGKNPTKRPLM